MRPMVRGWPPRRRRLVIAGLIVCLLPVIIAAAGLAALAAEGSGDPPSAVRAAGWDGLWLGHAWAGGQRTDADLDGLARRLRATGIRDVFVHTGPLSDNGSLDPRLAPRARWLVTGLHRRLPGLRVQAWLGDLVGPGHLDLASPAVRARIAGAAGRELGLGFDGIHYDLEPVPSGDPGFLALLAATRAITSARDKTLSVACAQVEPLPGLRVPARWAAGQPHFWSEAYLRAVARRADEIAVMTYDTGLPFGTDYSGIVRLETGLAVRAAPLGVSVLIGLPAYHTAEPGHTGAETVAAAVRGVRLALGSSRPRPNVGVALYADFSATPADWSAYLSGWFRHRGFSR